MTPRPKQKIKLYFVVDGASTIVFKVVIINYAIQLIPGSYKSSMSAY